MSDLFDDITDPGSVKALAAEMRHIRERHDDWNERQDVRLDKHGDRISALERSQWKAAGVAGALAALGAGLAAWFAVLTALARIAKGG